jgi:hypothetical protein
MCEFSSKLIAWMDAELPDDQMSAVNLHLAQCSECRAQAATFREVSHAFAVCMRAQTVPPARAWRPAVMVPAAIAAAVVLAALLMLPRHAHETKFERTAARVPAVAPVPSDKLVAMVPRPVPTRMLASRPHRAKSLARPSEWMPAEPTIQILIPGDALYPPGALPDGVDLVASLRFAAEGSPASLALRP